MNERVSAALVTMASACLVSSTTAAAIVTVTVTVTVTVIAPPLVSRRSGSWLGSTTVIVIVIEIPDASRTSHRHYDG